MDGLTGGRGRWCRGTRPRQGAGVAQGWGDEETGRRRSGIRAWGRDGAGTEAPGGSARTGGLGRGRRREVSCTEARTRGRGRGHGDAETRRREDRGARVTCRRGGGGRGRRREGTWERGRGIRRARMPRQRLLHPLVARGFRDDGEREATKGGLTAVAAMTAAAGVAAAAVAAVAAARVGAVAAGLVASGAAAATAGQHLQWTW